MRDYRLEVLPYAHAMISRSGLQCAHVKEVAVWYTAFTESQRTDWEVERSEGSEKGGQERTNFDTFCDDALDSWCVMKNSQGLCVRFKRNNTFGKTLDDQEIEERHKSEGSRRMKR